jgi:hypothetical protein
MSYQNFKQEQFDFQCASPPFGSYPSYSDTTYAFQRSNYYLSTPDNQTSYSSNPVYTETHSSYCYNHHEYNQNGSFNSSPASYYSSSDNSYNCFNSANGSYFPSDSAYQSSESLVMPPHQTCLTDTPSVGYSNDMYSLSPAQSEIQVSNAKKRPIEDCENEVKAESNEPHEIKYTQFRRPTKRPTVARMDNLEIQSVRCSYCSLEFENVAKRLMHENKHHRDGKANQCPICSKFFA